MKEEELSQGTCSSQRGVETVPTQTQNSKVSVRFAGPSLPHVLAHNMSLLKTRLLFATPMSPRVESCLCRWNEKFYTTVAVSAAATDDGKRSSTVCACFSLKQTL